MLLLSISIAVIAAILLCTQLATCFQPSLGGRRATGPSRHTLIAHTPKHTDSDDAAILSRRRMFGQVISSAAASSLILTKTPEISSAKVVATPLTTTSAQTSTPEQNVPPERELLLQAIANKASDEDIVSAIEKLVPLSPLKSSDDANKYESALSGEWRLLWYNKSDFSPLLKLPSPLRPDSYQYFGSIAEQEVGKGRVAQGLVGGVLNVLGGNTELWLSSGAKGQKNKPSTLEIYPPFRFEVGQLPGSNVEKRTIVEGGSDAEFRGAMADLPTETARDKAAQEAPKNEYEQLYCEDLGSGSLRISVVAKGDPVIVGDMFIHQKL